MRKGMLVALAIAWAPAWAADEERKPDPRARRLAVQGRKLADSVDDLWGRFWVERGKLTEEEIETLASTFTKAADTLNASLEIEERPGLAKYIMLIARKLMAVRLEEIRRESVRRSKRPRAGKEQRKEEAEEEEEEEAEEEEDQEQEEEEEGEAGDDDVVAENKVFSLEDVPEPQQTKAQRRRSMGALRRFILAHGSNRRVETLLDRCSRCNGTGRVKTGLTDKRRRPITVACKLCHETGWILNKPILRRAYWIAKSPLYRADPDNLIQYIELERAWHGNPRLIPEFIKSVKIESTEYHGLWARVLYTEKGTMPKERKRFTRVVDQTFVRIGKSWFFYDEKYDREFFTALGSRDG